MNYKKSINEALSYARQLLKSVSENPANLRLLKVAERLPRYIEHLENELVHIDNQTEIDLIKIREEINDAISNARELFKYLSKNHANIGLIKIAESLPKFIENLEDFLREIESEIQKTNTK